MNAFGGTSKGTNINAGPRSDVQQLEDHYTFASFANGGPLSLAEAEANEYDVLDVLRDLKHDKLGFEKPLCGFATVMNTCLECIKFIMLVSKSDSSSKRLSQESLGQLSTTMERLHSFNDSFAWDEQIFLGGHIDKIHNAILNGILGIALILFNDICARENVLPPDMVLVIDMLGDIANSSDKGPSFTSTPSDVLHQALRGRLGPETQDTSKRQESPKTSSAQPKSIKRSTACITCRNRKLRCDRNRPSCRVCVKDSQKCIYIVQGDFGVSSQGELRHNSEKSSWFPDNTISAPRSTPCAPCARRHIKCSPSTKDNPASCANCSALKTPCHWDLNLAQLAEPDPYYVEYRSTRILRLFDLSRVIHILAQRQGQTLQSLLDDADIIGEESMRPSLITDEECAEMNAYAADLMDLIPTAETWLATQSLKDGPSSLEHGTSSGLMHEGQQSAVSARSSSFNEHDSILTNNYRGPDEAETASEKPKPLLQQEDKGSETESRLDFNTAKDATSTRKSEHVAMKAETLPFVCAICGAGFRRRHNLKSHLLTHNARPRAGSRPQTDTAAIKKTPQGPETDHQDMYVRNDVKNEGLNLQPPALVAEATLVKSLDPSGSKVEASAGKGAGKEDGGGTTFQVPPTTNNYNANIQGAGEERNVGATRGVNREFDTGNDKGSVRSWPCDTCRARKIRCDGQHSTCTSCLQAGIECTSTDFQGSTQPNMEAEARVSSILTELSSISSTSREARDHRASLLKELWSLGGHVESGRVRDAQHSDSLSSSKQDSTVHPAQTDVPFKVNRLIRARTKTGCLACRKRRIKCDEERRPGCSNCRRNGRACSFSQTENSPKEKTGAANAVDDGLRDKDKQELDSTRQI